MKTFYLTFLLLAFTIVCFGKNSAITGIITIKSTDQPISGVQVEIEELGLVTSANDSGEYVFKNVPPGHYRIIFRHVGYMILVIKDVPVEAGFDLDLPAQLVARNMLQSYLFLSQKSQGKDSKTSAGPVTNSATNRHEGGSTKSSESKSNDAVEISKPPTIQDERIMEVPYSRHPGKSSVSNSLASGLKAGYADDNRQFNYFLRFLDKYGDEVQHYPLKVNNRIRLNVRDLNGLPLSNAEVSVFDEGRLLEKGRTLADGSFSVYPGELKSGRRRLLAAVQFNNVKQELSIDPHGLRELGVKLDCRRPDHTRLPLDLCFVLDVSASMGEEIARLKTTIDIINLNLSNLKINPDIRFGMVVYRDREDDFVTRVIPLTGDLGAFSRELNMIDADGGGDEPEDLQAALKDALQKMNWNDQAIRLGFVITDAAAHLDYKEKYTYAEAARDAHKAGIKFFSIGCGGLAIDGEYILRQISQFTGGKYIFLTYGERGESDGGKPGSVSHHSGDNYETDKLEALIIRFAREELAFQSPELPPQPDSYFLADPDTDQGKDQVLRDLFTQAMQELLDYSALRLPEDIAISATPIAAKFESQQNNAEYFSEQLMLALRRFRGLKLVERNDLQYVAREAGLQLTGIVEPAQAAKIGEFLGAEALVIGNLFFADDMYEIFLKLVRVETAEILSITKVKIDYRLAL